MQRNAADGLFSRLSRLNSYMNRLRVGHIQYINTYPIFYTILKERETLPFDLVSDTPARLNEMMREGTLDVSLISSFEYAASPERYLICRDFCLEFIASKK